MRLQRTQIKSQGKAWPEDRLTMANKTVLPSPEYRYGTVVRGEVVDAETKERYPLATSQRVYITRIVREMAGNDIKIPWPRSFRDVTGIRVNFTFKQGEDGKQYATNLVLSI